MDPFAIKDPAFWREQSFLLENGAICSVSSLPEPSVVFQTSGSTGVPKNIVLSKSSLLHSASAVNAHLQVDSSCIWGLCLPCWHVGGFAVAARSMQASCRMVVWPERWQAAAVVAWLREQRVSHLSLVPAQVHDVVQLGQRAPETLRAIVVGGGRLDYSLGQAARDLGWPVLASYGMTEAGSQIATQAIDSLSLPYQSDRLPLLPSWQVEADGDEVLSIRGPALFSGTWHSEHNRFVPRESDWYRTSDRGIVMERSLTILGRADDLVKVLGELVSPLKIESTLVDLGLAVGRFAVVAVPDERKEHRLVLVHEESEQAQVEAILAIYQGQAVGYERIDMVKSLPLLPRSDLVKIRRREVARFFV